MFRRRKHRQQTLPSPSAPVSQMPDAEHIATLVRAVVDDHIGATGRWVLVRRDDSVDVSDTIFQDLSCAALTHDIVESVIAAHTTPEAPSERRDAQDQRDSIRRELNTIAIWASPESHDPEMISAELVSAERNAAAEHDASIEHITQAGRSVS